MKYAYYPGCSMEVNAAAYDMSMRGIAKILGIEFAEIDDWNCCGATEYFSQDELTAASVVARNLETILVLGNLLGGLRGHLSLVNQS